MARKNDSTLGRLGESLRKVREERGWSQEELVFKAGIHRTYAAHATLSGSDERLRARIPWAALGFAHGYFRSAFQAESCAGNLV